MSVEIVKGRVIEVVRYGFQRQGMASFEIRPIMSATDRSLMWHSEVIVEAQRGTPAGDSSWVAFKRERPKGAPADRPYGIPRIEWDTVVLCRGPKRDCMAAAYEAIGEWLRPHIGGCVVCNHTPYAYRKIVRTHGGWAHQACLKEAQRGTRWIGDLEAPGRPLPDDQWGLCRVPEAAGPGGP